MANSRIRPAAMAGLFYTDEPQALRQQVTAYLTQTNSLNWQPKAIVTPHAGYSYSGSAAGKAWGSVASLADKIKRIVLLGPTHRVPIWGIATSTADCWQTPLGDIALDREAAEKLQSYDFVEENDFAHAGEHSLEVQVPFIQVAFPKARLLPMVVGEASPQQVASVLTQFWQDDETLIVISSDLSHFHDYHTAQQLDKETTQAIENFQFEAIGPEQACGCRPLSGLLKLLRERQGEIVTLDVINSGDTAGQRDRVVGYGAYAAH